MDKAELETLPGLQRQCGEGRRVFPHDLCAFVPLIRVPSNSSAQVVYAVMNSAGSVWRTGILSMPTTVNTMRVPITRAVGSGQGTSNLLRSQETTFRLL